jgi:DNA-directed RNA polymerase subunit RPC12/RpoP
LLEKFYLAAIFMCRDCGREHTVNFLGIWPHLSLVARCPRCGTRRLRQLKKIDHIETMYKNPLSRLQKFIGAPLLYCFRCRLQFYDYRRRENPADT